MQNKQKEIIVFDLSKHIAEQNRSKGGRAVVHQIPAKEDILFATSKNPIHDISLPSKALLEYLQNQAPEGMELSKVAGTAKRSAEKTDENEKAGETSLSTILWASIKGKLNSKKKSSNQDQGELSWEYQKKRD